MVRLRCSTAAAAIPMSRSTPSSGATPRDVYITFRINEGEPIRVTELDSHRPRLAPGETPAGRRWWTFPLQRGRPVQPVRHAGRPPTRSPAGCETAAIRRRGSSPASRPTRRRRDGDRHLRRRAGQAVGGHRRGQRGRDQPDRAAGRSQPADLAPGPALLAGRAVPEPAQPLLLRPVPLRHGQHRLARSSSREADSVPLVVQVSEAAPAADPRRPRLRHRRLLPRLRSAGPRAISWGAAAASSTSPAGSRRWAWGRRSTGDSADGICSNSREDSVGSAKVNFSLGASVRRPAFLSPNNTIAVSLFTERRSEFKVYLRQETGHHAHASARDAEAIASRSRWPTRCPTATPRPRPRASAPPSTPARRTWSRCCGRTACSRRSRPPARCRRSTTRSIRRAARWRRAEVTWSSRLLGSSSFQQFFAGVGGLLLVSPDRAGRGLQLAGARRRDLRADGGRRHPERQLHSARAAVLRRRPQRRARLRAERARPVVYVVPKGEVDSAASQRARHQPRLGDGGGHRRQHARGRQRRAPGARRPCSARGSGSPRSWTRAASGSAAAATPPRSSG